MDVQTIRGHAGVALVRAANPGALTLTGTNTWILGRDPAWVVDPGPALAEHVAAVAAAVEERGGAGGIAVTHDHADHAEAVHELAARLGNPPVAASRLAADVTLRDGDEFGPLRALHLPGHSDDHMVFLYGRACCTGDAVLGQGSVFVGPGPGSLAGYLEGLRRLAELDLALICPGHGPPVDDPAAKLREYLRHRLDRERRLVEALAAGARSQAELLDRAWSDVPGALRPAAAITLAAHLHKLAEEGRLPPDMTLPRRA